MESLPGSLQLGMLKYLPPYLQKDFHPHVLEISTSEISYHYSLTSSRPNPYILFMEGTETGTPSSLAPSCQVPPDLDWNARQRSLAV